MKITLRPNIIPIKLKTMKQNNTPEPEHKTMVIDGYIGTQTPIERLRNKLTPFVNLVEILHSEGDLLGLPFILSDNKDIKNDLFLNALKTCVEYKEEIKTHLSDCEIFYSEKESNVNGYPTKKVCFFKFENGKYITDNGLEITDDMLIKHSHYIGFPWNYIVME